MTSSLILPAALPVAADDLGQALQLILRATNSGSESGLALMNVLEHAHLPSVSNRLDSGKDAGGYCGITEDGAPFTGVSVSGASR